MKAKTKRCKQCKEKHTANEKGVFDMFKPPNSLGFFCDTECVADWTRDNPIKLQKLYRTNVGRELKEFRSNDIKLRKKAAKEVCHKYIRERDRYKGCISCGSNLDGTKYDAGHLIESGNYPFIRFNENNIFGQCVYCNQHKGGNESEARIGAEKRIGKEDVQWLYDNKNKKTDKLTIEYYKEIEKYYKDKLKQLTR